MNVQTNAECWVNKLGMNKNVSKIIAKVKLSFQREFKKYIFTTKLVSFSRQQALYIGYNWAEAEAEERQLFESKARLYNFAVAEGRKKKLVAEEDKLLEDDNGTKVVLLGVSGVVSPGASALVPSELLSGHWW